MGQRKISNGRPRIGLKPITMPCQGAQSHSDSKMWWNSGIVIKKCGGTEWHSVAVTVKSGTTVEQWNSGTAGLTVIVKCDGTVSQ